MRFITPNGKIKVLRNIRKYEIDWDGKSLSKFQFEVKQFLKEYWVNHIVYEELPVVGTRMSIDLFNASKRIAVEVQGAFHSQYNKHFHNNNRFNFLNQIKRDVKKAEWCELNNIILVEIYPKDMPLTKELFNSFGAHL